MRVLKLPALIYFISLALLVASLVFQLSMVHSDFANIFHSASNPPNNWDGVIVIPLISFGIIQHAIALCFAPKNYPWWPGLALIVGHFHIAGLLVVVIPMILITQYLRKRRISIV